MKRTWRFSGIGFVVSLLLVFLCMGNATAAKDTLVYVMGAEPMSADPPNQSDNMSETIIKHKKTPLTRFEKYYAK